MQCRRNSCRCAYFGGFIKYAIAILLLASTANAKEYKFTYSFEKETLVYRTEAKTWEEAFKSGADCCFEFFKNVKPLTEDRGLDIIDVCANPK